MKLKILLIVFCIFLNSSFAKTQKEEYSNDYLYSEAYFDYLIECAADEHHKQKDSAKEEVVVTLEDEVIDEHYEPFKLRVESHDSINPYSETFKVENTKTIIPLGDTFSFYQNTTKSKNKYNSNDYRILAGAEYTPVKFFSLAGGFESNYRSLDQNPTSRKLYIIPSIYITDKISLSFYNKMNVQSYSTDHDIGLKISPFKSKVMDFGIYAGLTRSQSGSHSESINFSTNIYLY